MLLPVHSHRDSDLEQPLALALKHHFASVEADVWVVGGELLIGHEREEVAADRTLEEVYLRPLLKAATDGRIASAITLLVDIKNEPEIVFQELHRRLRHHRELLTRLEAGQVVPGCIRVLLSGERPIELARQDSSRLVFIDGRLPDVGADAGLFPSVSLDWASLFSWNGEGSMPPEVARTVSRLVDQTHSAGQTLRFWGTTDNPTMWSALLDLGVDLVSVDEVEAVTTFLAGRGATSTRP
jgi:hypothetical protein